MGYFGAVPTVWYILELFQQCGIFWSFSNSVVYFGAVPTVWYFLELFQQCGIFGAVPTVVFLELFQPTISGVVKGFGVNGDIVIRFNHA